MILAIVNQTILPASAHCATLLCSQKLNATCPAASKAAEHCRTPKGGRRCMLHCCASVLLILAHFNQRHHRVLYAEAFSLEFVGCTGRFDTKRSADQHAHFGKWLRDDEAVPASQSPAARIFQIHW